MKVHTEDRGEAVIVHPVGRLTAGGNDQALRQEVVSALDGGARKVIIDLGEVSYMDSTGVAELVSAYTSAACRHAEVGLARLTPKVHSVIECTHLDSILPVYDSAEQALQA